MEDEAQRSSEVDRGNKAKVILTDPLFQESFEQLRELYLTAWEKTTMKDSEGRERLWMMIANLGDVKAHLTTVLETGKMSSKQLDDIESEYEDSPGIVKQTLKEWGIRK